MNATTHEALEAWRTRQLANLEWRERFWAQREHVTQLEAENAALRAKCAFLLEQLQNEAALNAHRRPPASLRRNVQSLASFDRPV